MNKIKQGVMAVVLGVALTACANGGGTPNPQAPVTVKPASESDGDYAPAAMISTAYKVLDSNAASVMGTPLESKISHYSLSYPKGERYTPGDESNGAVEATFLYESVPAEELKKKKFNGWAASFPTLYDRCVDENGEGFTACYVDLLDEEESKGWNATFKWVSDLTEKDENGVAVSVVYNGAPNNEVTTRFSGLTADGSPAELIATGYERFDKHLSTFDSVTDHRVQYHTPLYKDGGRWDNGDVKNSTVQLYYELEPTVESLKDVKTVEGSTVYEFCDENYSLEKGSVECRAELDLGEDWTGLFSWEHGVASLFVRHEGQL